MKSFFNKMWIYFLYLLLVLADGALTFYNTPDLNLEGNPLITKLGLGWPTVIVFNLIILAQLYFLCRYSFEEYKTAIVPSQNCREYYSMLCFGRPDWFWQTWYKWPKYWRWFPAILGFISVYGLAAARLVVVLEWTAITLNLDVDAYFRFRRMIPLHRADIWVALIVASMMFVVWIRNERKISEQTLKGACTT